MSKPYDCMPRAYSKDWCKGFCRTCGTGCGQYCEEIHRLQLKVQELEGYMEDAGYKWCTDEHGEFWVKGD